MRREAALVGGLQVQLDDNDDCLCFDQGTLGAGETPQRLQNIHRDHAYDAEYQDRSDYGADAAGAVIASQLLHRVFSFFG
jgi:hypothetical protein